MKEKNGNSNNSWPLPLGIFKLKFGVYSHIKIFDSCGLECTSILLPLITFI